MLFLPTGGPVLLAGGPVLLPAGGPATPDFLRRIIGAGCSALECRVPRAARVVPAAAGTRS